MNWETGSPDRSKHAWDVVDEAFGRKALVYDAFGENHPNLERMRTQVRRQVESVLPAGASLLEINAGTGADALYFARRGYHVYATDISAQMVGCIRSKIAQSGLDDHLSAQQLSFLDLDQIQEPLWGQKFDGIFSNMGGINCTENLDIITHSLPQLLKPGGVVVWVIMPPICPWELAQALRGHFKLALRRLQPGGVLANIEGLPVRTYYYNARQAKAAFGAQFRCDGLQGLSVFAPPADHKEFPRRFPRLYRTLVWLDSVLSKRFPFRSWGDFYILTMRYQPGGG